jgi:hypothetical protein
VERNSCCRLIEEIVSGLTTIQSSKLRVMSFKSTR